MALRCFISTLLLACVMSFMWSAEPVSAAGSGTMKKSEKYFSQAEILREKFETAIHEGNLPMEDVVEALTSAIAKYNEAIKALPAEGEAARRMRDYCAVSVNLIFASYTNTYTYDYGKAYEDLRKNEEIIGRFPSDDLRTRREKRMNDLLLGDVHANSGFFKEALKCYENILEYDLMASQEKSIASAAVHRRVGAIYSSLNDAGEALRHFAEAESVLKGGRDDAEYVRLLLSRAALYRNMAEYESAIRDYSVAVQIQERYMGKKHISVLLTKIDLLECRIEAGADMDEVGDPLDLYDEAMDTPETHPVEFRRLLEIIAKECFEIREYDYAIDFLKEAMDFVGNYAQTAVFDIRSSLYLLGECYLMKGEPAKALETYEKMFDLERRFVREVFSFLPESSRATYWASCDRQMNGLFELNRQRKIFSDPGIAGLLYDAALFHKGLLLEATMGIADIVMESGDESLQADFRRLQSLRQRISDGVSDSGRLEKEAVSIELRIMEKISDYGDFLHYTDIKWQDVRNALGENEAAIEFVTSGSTRHGTVYYSAELIRHDSKAPEHIFMFALSPAEQGRWQGPGIYDSPVIGKKIWSAILPHLQGCGHIWFAASGELHNTAIEYLKISDSTRINDIFTLGRLSSTRQVAMKPRAGLSREAVLYGGLNYNTDPEYMEYYAKALSDSRLRGAVRNRAPGDRKYLPWGYLKGTKEEVDGIAGILSGRNYDVEIYTGDSGIEESFKSLSGQRKQIIHIATHGFYIPDTELRDVLSTEDKALLSSGIVFSGANRAWLGQRVEGMDDGILTAREISLTDLRGTDLVVLSACQTGLGYVSGDGVFGLQRGFKKAGAGTLLMSLWEVDDVATRMLTAEFYRNLLGGKDKYEALRDAQKSIGKAVFIVDGVSVSGSDPYFWASFILLD